MRYLIRILAFAVLPAVCSQVLSAQGLSYGVRAGLNVSSFKGPAEPDNTGKELDAYSSITGFHVGASFQYKFTDIFGVRLELLYSQKGGQYDYSGPSFLRFTNSALQPVYLTGIRDMKVSVTNSYLELPLTGVVRLGRVEVSGGLVGNILISSTGGGTMAFTTQLPNSTQSQTLDLQLEYKFFKDEPGGSPNPGDVVLLSSGPSSAGVPRTLGAYYEQEQDQGPYFKRFDVNATAGLSFYLNSSLYVGARGLFGLVDVTNNDADLAYFSLSGGKPSFRTDKDVTYIIQGSVGFSF